MNLVYWPKPELPTGASDITKLRILRSNDRFGTFVECAVITPAHTPIVAPVPPATEPTGGVYTLQYFDTTGEQFHWYVIEYLTTTGTAPNTTDIVVTKTDPMKGEVTYTSVIELMWKFRRKIGDLGTSPCFADYELMEQLNEALVLHNRFMTWDTLPENEQTLVLWIAIANICLVLAQDSSKFYMLSIDGVTVDKSNRVEKYTALSDKYMQRYEDKKEEWRLAAERSGTIKESYMTRESFTTGRRTPYIHATPPEPVIMLPPTKITAGSVDLRWTVSLDPGFYYYVIFRATAPNVQKSVIQDIYHKRIALYDDPGDYTTNLYGGLTTPVRMIFRNSVDFWPDQNRTLADPFYVGPYPKLYPNSDYYYVIATVNKNILMSLSNEIHVRTPALAAPELFTPIRQAEGLVFGTGVATAQVFVEHQPVASTVWNPIANVQLKAGPAPSYRFTFPIGNPLVAGSKVRAYQIFNAEQSPYTAEIAVI